MSELITIILLVFILAGLDTLITDRGLREKLQSVVFAYFFFALGVGALWYVGKFLFYFTVGVLA